jgi:hypothetical protein
MTNEREPVSFRYKRLGQLPFLCSYKIKTLVVLAFSYLIRFQSAGYFPYPLPGLKLYKVRPHILEVPYEHNLFFPDWCWSLIMLLAER